MPFSQPTLSLPLKLYFLYELFKVISNWLGVALNETEVMSLSFINWFSATYNLEATICLIPALSTVFVIFANSSDVYFLV